MPGLTIQGWNIPETSRINKITSPLKIVLRYNGEDYLIKQATPLKYAVIIITVFLDEATGYGVGVPDIKGILEGAEIEPVDVYGYVGKMQYGNKEMLVAQSGSGLVIHDVVYPPLESLPYPYNPTAQPYSEKIKEG